MRCIVKFSIPTEHGNKLIKDASFGQKVNQMLHDMKAEKAYFTTHHGMRGGYIVCDVPQASSIPGLFEPLFLWLHAEIEVMPVMVPEDLAAAGAGIGAAVQKWG